MKIAYPITMLFLLPCQAFAQDFRMEKEITQKVILHFEVNEVAEIYQLFDSTMKSALSAEKLSNVWQSLTVQCGMYLGSGSAVASKVQEFVVVNQFLDFEKTDLDLRLAFDAERKISGLYFVPPVRKKE